MKAVPPRTTPPAKAPRSVTRQTQQLKRRKTGRCGHALVKRVCCHSFLGAYVSS